MHLKQTIWLAAAAAVVFCCPIEARADSCGINLNTSPTCFTVNLGTGKGSSVLEVVKAFEQASGKPIPYQMQPRRAGDVATCYAATNRAAKYLDGWQAARNLDAMCRDHWRWQSQNPNGYGG